MGRQPLRQFSCHNCTTSASRGKQRPAPLQGTAKRWEAVAAFVRTRTVEEVIDMVKHGLKAGRHARGADSAIAIAKKRQVGRPLRYSAHSPDWPLISAL